jgi:hypothetical protein
MGGFSLNFLHFLRGAAMGHEVQVMRGHHHHEYQ